MHHDDCYDEGDEDDREIDLEDEGDGEDMQRTIPEDRYSKFLQPDDYDARCNRSIASEGFLLLKKECRRIETEHGFGKQNPVEDIALFHSELSEALEELRNGRGINETYYNEDKPTKPEGVPTELADCIIRILGFCARHDIDILSAIVVKMRYNESRPFKHGGKTI